MSADRDILFLLEPGFAENGQRWFCPYTAQVVGMLSWFPDLRLTLDIREVGFAKPRQQIVELIGEELQSCPVLVLAENSKVPEEVSEFVVYARGRRAISKTMAILRYLSLTHDLPQPH